MEGTNIKDEYGQIYTLENPSGHSKCWSGSRNLRGMLMKQSSEVGEKLMNLQNM